MPNAVRQEMARVGRRRASPLLQVVPAHPTHVHSNAVPLPAAPPSAATPPSASGTVPGVPLRGIRESSPLALPCRRFDAFLAESPSRRAAASRILLRSAPGRASRFGRLRCGRLRCLLGSEAGGTRVSQLDFVTDRSAALRFVPALRRPSRKRSGLRSACTPLGGFAACWGSVCFLAPCAGAVKGTLLHAQQPLTRPRTAPALRVPFSTQEG